MHEQPDPKPVSATGPKGDFGRYLDQNQGLLGVFGAISTLALASAQLQPGLIGLSLSVVLTAAAALVWTEVIARLPQKSEDFRVRAFEFLCYILMGVVVLGAALAFRTLVVAAVGYFAFALAMVGTILLHEKLPPVFHKRPWHLSYTVRAIGQIYWVIGTLVALFVAMLLAGALIWGLTALGSRLGIPDILAP